ncbi:unnamed protein product [Camellia sinensis]
MLILRWEGLSPEQMALLCYMQVVGTQVIAYSEGRYRIFGDTKDIAVGNCLDRFGNCFLCLMIHTLGTTLSSTLAKKGEKFIDLPYVVKGRDVSFSGILSYPEEKLKNNACTSADLCYSLQRNCVSNARGDYRLSKKDVLIVGGVGCNERLQEMMRIMCSERGRKLFATDDRYCVDSGAMIAYTGFLVYANETSTLLEESTFTQWFRTDEVLAIWREKRKSSNGLMEKRV